MKTRTAVLAMAVAVLGMLGGLVLTGAFPAAQPVELVPQALVAHTPGELLRYVQRRLEGHPRLQVVALPLLHALQRQVERSVPGLLPSLGKGAQQQPLLLLRYDEAGRPSPLPPGAAVAGMMAAGDRILHDTTEIGDAMAHARPGQRLVIAPGRYRITARLRTRVGGTPDAPIVLAATRPGDVTLEVDAAEGIVVSHPYWVFENLHLRGVCGRHDDCEHAFHVVGAAQATVVRNNLIEDFNAHVKVNGFQGQWPDDGLLQFNTIRNGTARNTSKPVTPVDIVGASGWRVVDNVIAHFVKAQGNGVSFGAFMKGAGRHGHFERNLVICTAQGMSQPGTRAGISMGGGGTGSASCRDERCEVEHEDGLIRNNIVAHCNDSGIHVFRSRGVVIAHNTLVNTAGVEVRVPPAQAFVHANMVEGRVRARDGGVVSSWDNVTGLLPGLQEQADALMLEPQAAMVPTKAAAVPVAMDFCGWPRGASLVPGAVSRSVPCAAGAAP